jgi:hypothetical protein
MMLRGSDRPSGTFAPPTPALSLKSRSGGHCRRSRLAQPFRHDSIRLSPGIRPPALLDRLLRVLLQSRSELGGGSRPFVGIVIPIKLDHQFPTIRPDQTNPGGNPPKITTRTGFTGIVSDDPGKLLRSERELSRRIQFRHNPYVNRARLPLSIVVQPIQPAATECSAKATPITAPSSRGSEPGQLQTHT